MFQNIFYVNIFFNLFFFCAIFLCIFENVFQKYKYISVQENTSTYLTFEEKLDLLSTTRVKHSNNKNSARNIILNAPKKFNITIHKKYKIIKNQRLTSSRPSTFVFSLNVGYCKTGNVLS